LYRVVINQNEAKKIIVAMPAKENIYGLLGPKKLNPNLIAIGAILVTVVLILVYSGRHSRITISKVVSIETNIPANDSSKSNK
jgi:hypothetical protein